MSSKSLKRKRGAQPEEISFDPAARHEYLTGFHKRKIQRARQAQKTAAKKERESRIEARKLLREERKAELQKHLDAVNGAPGDDATGSGTESPEWQGLGDLPKIDHEAEYIDEDRYTTVTVEAVSVERDGLQRINAEEDSNSANDEVASDEVRGQDPKKSKATPSETAKSTKRVWTKMNPNQGKKRKRKKYRYETKDERKATKFKERAKNRAQAQARRQRAQLK